MTTDDIDFVITWVDGADPKWLKDRAKYLDGHMQIDESRFRDLGFLKYWFRAIEENAPWVRKIHFVTYGHIPKWLNTENPKLSIVKHDDFIEKKYLPTFNSCAIEMNLHKIPNLSNKFIYFNDDMYLNAPVKADFFFKHNKPRGTYENKPLMAGNHDAAKIHFNCNILANNQKSKREFYAKLLSPSNGALVCAQNIAQFAIYGFAGFGNIHTPTAFLKEAYANAINAAQEEAIKTNQSRFRNSTNISQWYCDFYQKAKAIVSPKSKKGQKYYNLAKDYKKAAIDITNAQNAIICINDTDASISGNNQASFVIEAFETRYNNKSSFEK